MANADVTEIVLIVDCSSSMTPIWGKTKEAIDTFIAEQKAVPGQASLTLVQFSTEVRPPVLENAPLSAIAQVEIGEAHGMTALLDAIGLTVDRVGARLSKTPESRRPGRVLVCIFTDGQENNSQEHRGAEGWASVQKKIKTQQDQFSWKFVFMGANQDAIGVAVGLGIDRNAAMSWSASSKGVGVAVRSFGAYATSYRNAPDVAVANETVFTDTDRKDNEP
jgi:hypothetical protein